LSHGVLGLPCLLISEDIRCFSMFFFQDYVLIQLSCGQTARLPRELLDFEAFPGDELMDLVVTHVSPQGAATRSEVAIMRPKREKIFG